MRGSKLALLAACFFLGLSWVCSGSGIEHDDVAANGRRILTVPGGLAVPLTGRNGVVRRRGLLRNGTLPILGAVREVGYFYTNLHLGTPPRKFSVIIDTGSTITYIPCAGCKHCGTHTDGAFDPDQSTTSKKLACEDPLCNSGSPRCTCKDQRCYYSRTYAERSSSEGWLIEDNFLFPDEQPAVRMTFGCENGETGEIFRQSADGIMGMGNNNNAFQSQLVANGVIEDMFSLCFGYPNSGILLLGNVPLPPQTKTIFTPLVDKFGLHYYNVRMEGITIGGVQVPLNTEIFDRGYGTVLDSGTTFTYLPTDAFNAFAEGIGRIAVEKGFAKTPGADPQYNDICFKGAPEEMKDLEGLFPEAEFVFGDNARLRLTPMRYLFTMGKGSYCLGIFDNGGSGTLVGGVSVRNVIVQYDRKNMRVGFTELPCTEFWSSFPTPTPEASPPPPPPPSPSPPPAPPPPAVPAASTNASASTPGNQAPSQSPDKPKHVLSSGGGGAEYLSEPKTHGPVTGGTVTEAQSAGGFHAIMWTIAVLIVVVAVAEVAVFHRRQALQLLNGALARVRSGAENPIELEPLSTKAAADRSVGGNSQA